jgi:RNA polymerase primary sigma factor
MKQLKITKQITNRDSKSVDHYLNEVSKLEMISANQEIELAKRIREGDDAALHKLVKANLRFVISVAKKYQNLGMTLGDLINEGNLGLIKAAQRFDETRGFKFISYAVWWIRQTILQALAEQSRIVRLPSNKIGSLNSLNRAFSELEQKYEREPTSEELAAALDTTPEEIEKINLTKNRKVSIDAPLSFESESGTLLDIMENKDMKAPDSEWINNSLQLEVKKVLSILTEQEAKIISKYYGLTGGHAASLKEISEDFGISCERVRQIKQVATRKLKHSSRKEILKTYL